MKNESLETQETAQPELFTASDVADFCQVDLKTIHNWADKGEIRHFRTPGRHLRFRRLDVLDFLRKYGYPIPEVAAHGQAQGRRHRRRSRTSLAAVRRGLSRRFDLTTFQDPFDALVAVGNLQPDAMILDVKMPGSTACRCLERLRSIDATAHIRCIVYSSQTDMKRAALDAGASEFVMKGDVTELKESLERVTGLNAPRGAEVVTLLRMERDVLPSPPQPPSLREGGALVGCTRFALALRRRVATTYSPTSERRLAIEVDAPSHAERQRRDRLRDSFFRRRGIAVLRFTN